MQWSTSLATFVAAAAACLPFLPRTDLRGFSDSLSEPDMSTSEGSVSSLLLLSSASACSPDSAQSCNLPYAAARAGAAGSLQVCQTRCAQASCPRRRHGMSTGAVFMPTSSAIILSLVGKGICAQSLHGTAGVPAQQPSSGPLSGEPQACCPHHHQNRPWPSLPCDPSYWWPETPHCLCLTHLTHSAFPAWGLPMHLSQLLHARSIT